MSRKQEKKHLWKRRDLLKMAAAGVPLVLTAKNNVQAKMFDNLLTQTNFRTEMREIPASQKFLIANRKDGSPDPRGWYHHSLGIVETSEGLVCTYRQTDAHTGLISNIMVCH